MPVVINTDITNLDVDNSNFTQMLTSLGLPGLGLRKTIPAGRLRKGDWVTQDGKQWVVMHVGLEKPDDWFNEKRIAVIAQPWHDWPRYEWCEDQLMPFTSMMQKLHKASVAKTLAFGYR